MPSVSFMWGLSSVVKLGLSGWAFWSYVQGRGLEDEIIGGVRAIPTVISYVVTSLLAIPGGGR